MVQHLCHFTPLPYCLSSFILILILILSYLNVIGDAMICFQLGGRMYIRRDHPNDIASLAPGVAATCLMYDHWEKGGACI